MADVKGTLLPIYFVADKSGSMVSAVKELNDGLTALLDALHSEAMAAAKVRFTVLGFSDSLRCYLELADLRNLEAMPQLAAGGSTKYSLAFQDLRTRIDRDFDRLKANEYQVVRPAIFFLTDGQPDADDPWETALSTLKSEGFKRRPNILAFGVGEAHAETILEVASTRDYAFVAAKGSDTGAAIVRFCNSLTRSVVSSGHALATGSAQLPVEKPEGFTLAVDVLD